MNRQRGEKCLGVESTKEIYSNVDQMTMIALQISIAVDNESTDSFTVGEM